MGWFTKKSDKNQTARDEIWTVCDKCKAHIFKEDWNHNLKVCPKCNFHSRLGAYERIGQILDSGSFNELFGNISPADPLSFVDSKGSYADRIVETKIKTKLNDSVVTGYGTINGIAVSLSVMDFRFLGGSLGSGTGEKILQGGLYALKNNLPYIIFSASGGARMHEGILSLMQMAKTCAGIAKLDDKKLPYISVLTDPTTGGVSASFATVGDINLAEPGALIGFAGRRVIETTIKQKLPENFQTSEYLLEHGFVDAIVPRSELRQKLALILSYYIRK